MESNQNQISLTFLGAFVLLGLRLIFLLLDLLIFLRLLFFLFTTVCGSFGNSFSLDCANELAIDGDDESFDSVGYGLYDCCCGAFM